MENIYYVYDKETGFIKGCTGEKDFETVMINIFNKELDNQFKLIETFDGNIENLVRIKEKVKMLEDETRTRDLNIKLSRNIASGLGFKLKVKKRNINSTY